MGLDLLYPKSWYVEMEMSKLLGLPFLNDGFVHGFGLRGNVIVNPALMIM